MNNKLYCEKCGREHDGSYGTGRFCSAKCARSFSANHVSQDGRIRQALALNDPENREKGRKVQREKAQKKREELKIKYENKEIKPLLDPDNLHVDSKLFKGKLGEYKAMEKFLRNDVPVYIPIVDTGVDMIADINGEFKTIQVKSSSNVKGVNKDKVCFNLTKRKRTIHNGIYTDREEKYDVDEIDYFALYNLLNDDIYLVKNTEDLAGKLTIRCNQIPEGCQTVYGNYDVDYDFDSVLQMEMNGLDSINIIPGEYKEVEE